MENFIKNFKEGFQNFTTSEKAQIINSIYQSVSSEFITIPNEEKGFAFEPVNNIVFVRQLKSGNIVIRTIGSEVSFKSFPYDLVEFLEENNENFKCLNYGLLANMTKMKQYDSFKNVVYFDNGAQVDVTRSAIKNIVSKQLGKINDISEQSIFKMQYN
nr:hypothetical protein [Mycobacterium sp. E3298]